MNFNLLSQKDLREIVYSNSGSFNYPFNYRERKHELVDIATQQYTQAIQNNYQNYVLKPPLLALDRSIRFPQKSNVKYTKDQILNLDENYVSIFNEIYQIGPSTDNRRIIYKILKLQGFIMPDFQDEIKVNYYKELVKHTKQKMLTYVIDDVDILDVKKLEIFNHFTRDPDLDKGLKNKLFKTSYGTTGDTPGGLFFAPNYEWVIYSTCRLAYDKKDFKYQYKIDINNEEVKDLKIMVLDNLGYFEELKSGRKINFDPIIKRYDGIYIPFNFQRLGYFLSNTPEFEGASFFLSGLDIETLIIWNFNKLKLRKVHFDYDKFTESNPITRDCLNLDFVPNSRI